MLLGFRLELNIRMWSVIILLNCSFEFREELHSVSCCDTWILFWSLCGNYFADFLGGIRVLFSFNLVPFNSLDCKTLFRFKFVYNTLFFDMNVVPFFFFFRLTINRKRIFLLCFCLEAVKKFPERLFLKYKGFLIYFMFTFTGVAVLVWNVCPLWSWKCRNLSGLFLMTIACVFLPLQDGMEILIRWFHFSIVLYVYCYSWSYSTLLLCFFFILFFWTYRFIWSWSKLAIDNSTSWASWNHVSRRSPWVSFCRQLWILLYR